MTAATSLLRLHDVLAQHARSRPDAFAIGDGEVRLTWREFGVRVERCALALHGAGVGVGDRVLWLGQNSFRVQELLLACSRLGAMLCPANWRMSVDELAFVVDDLAPSIVFTQTAEVGDTVGDALGAASHRALAEIAHDVDEGYERWVDEGYERWVDDGYERWVDEGYERWVDDGPSRGALPPDLASGEDALLLVGTAAFDGRSNFAMLPHRAIIGQALFMGPLMGVDDTSRYLNAGPLFHVGVFMENFATFVAGGANVFVRRVDGADLCRTIEEFACTSGYIVGPMVDAIVAANSDGRYDLSSLRGRRGNAQYDCWVQADDSPWGRHPGGYGQTETMGMQTFNLLAPRDAIGSHGRPSPLVQVRVVDPDDHDLAAGETGEIIVRGATVMCGYWNRPDVNTARARNGWHHTNDLGRYEKDGSFTFVGPKGRMLKSAAENIYPIEVENALRSHPGVADAAVIGVPDDVWVQSVKAIVVLRDATSATADELIEHCRTKIASYKKPRTIEFVDSLPRQGWSVDYDALDARYGGGAYPGGTTRSA